MFCIEPKVIKMARMYPRNKGKSGSKKPIKKAMIIKNTGTNDSIRNDEFFLCFFLLFAINVTFLECALALK